MPAQLGVTLVSGYPTRGRDVCFVVTSCGYTCEFTGEEEQGEGCGNDREEGGVCTKGLRTKVGEFCLSNFAYDGSWSV
jgi:hypothetical protein